MKLGRESAEVAQFAVLGEDEQIPPGHDLCPSPPTTGFLSELFRGQGDRLRRFFERRGEPASADDLLQETFVRLAGATSRKPAQIEQPGAYVNQIARNLLREQARFAARRSAAFHIDIDDVVVPGPDPMAELEARDMLRRLEGAMAKMKPETREIFMAHRIDGNTYAQIADRMGLSVKRVEKHLAKAMLVVNRTLRSR